MLAKFRHVENLILLGTLSGAMISFFYAEESVLLKISSVVLAILAILTVLKEGKSKTVSSKYEFLSLLIIYLGTFGAYNFLYLVNLPLYAAMIIILVLVTLVTFSVLKLDKINSLISKEVFFSLILLFGLTILEIFLSLYFLSIDPAIQSLILVVIYYFLLNVIYLYVNSMLRLNKVIGFLIISIIILIAIVLSTWFGLSR